eukprot:130536-Chlamydomonas_euryale.AAC.7
MPPSPPQSALEPHTASPHPRSNVDAMNPPETLSSVMRRSSVSFSLRRRVTVPTDTSRGSSVSRHVNVRLRSAAYWLSMRKMSTLHGLTSGGGPAVRLTSMMTVHALSGGGDGGDGGLGAAGGLGAHANSRIGHDVPWPTAKYCIGKPTNGAPAWLRMVPVKRPPPLNASV